MTTITTAAELDALPVGSVVARLHNDGRGNSVYTLHWDGWYSATEPLRPWVGDASDQCDGRMPDLTVLYRPDQPEPVKPSREDVTHDAEVAAKALEDAAAHVHGFSASFTSPDYQRGRAYEQACLWLRARAAAIRAETQREGVGCKHCGRPIAGEGGHIHTAGANRGLHRCDPNDSGLPYGLCAEAVGDACGPICTGGQ